MELRYKYNDQREREREREREMCFTTYKIVTLEDGVM